MKIIAVLLIISSLAISAPAVAAPVTLTFQNVSTTTTMNVSHVSTCGVLSPPPAAVALGKTSPPSSTDCGSTATSSHVKYAMPYKTCAFHLSTFYTLPNPLTGASGYWTPSALTTPSGGATCKVVSVDVSNMLTTGAVKAVFSMK